MITIQMIIIQMTTIQIRSIEMITVQMLIVEMMRIQMRTIQMMTVQIKTIQILIIQIDRLKRLAARGTHKPCETSCPVVGGATQFSTFTERERGGGTYIYGREAQNLSDCPIDCAHMDTNITLSYSSLNLRFHLHLINFQFGFRDIETGNLFFFISIFFDKVYS